MNRPNITKHSEVKPYTPSSWVDGFEIMVINPFPLICCKYVLATLVGIASHMAYWKGMKYQGDRDYWLMMSLGQNYLEVQFQ